MEGIKEKGGEAFRLHFPTLTWGTNCNTIVSRQYWYQQACKHSLNSSAHESCCRLALVLLRVQKAWYNPLFPCFLLSLNPCPMLQQAVKMIKLHWYKHTRKKYCWEQISADVFQEITIKMSPTLWKQNSNSTLSRLEHQLPFGISWFLWVIFF